MNANDVHLEALRWAYDLLGMVMADATDEMAHTMPPGTANPLASTYAHALLGLDHIPRVFLQGKAPLYEGAWAGRTSWCSG